MKNDLPPAAAPWTLARRTERMNPSAIREILKLTERPGVISLAGGLPAPSTFPLQAFAEAAQQVLREDGPAALQYAASEGYGPLREMLAARLPWPVDASEVLITTGSQQGLDLVAKVLLDAGSRVLVETPSYLGALQSFNVQEPEFVSVPSDDHGVVPEALTSALCHGARFAYLLPNFQNPTGRTLSEARRQAISTRAAELGLPLIEDNPYGDLWYGSPPLAPLTARNPQGCIYLGSLSKVLAPGLRLGFVVAPKPLFAKLLQAKQAADLHSPTFNQRVAARVMANGFLDTHLPPIRALYQSQRDAMLTALTRHASDLGLSWNQPQGGMFLWAQLPAGLDATTLLPQAVARGMAYVPGAPFYADPASVDARTLRLSFVTASAEQIDQAIAALAATVRAALATR